MEWSVEAGANSQGEIEIFPDTFMKIILVQKNGFCLNMWSYWNEIGVITQYVPGIGCCIPWLLLTVVTKPWRTVFL